MYSITNYIGLCYICTIFESNCQYLLRSWPNDHGLLLVFKCPAPWLLSLRRNCVLHCAESQDCPVELKLCRATSPVYPVWQYAVCPGTCSIVRCLMYSVQHVHCAISGYSLSYCNVMYDSDPGIVHCYRCTAAWLLCRNSDPMCSTLTGARRSTAVHCQGVNWLWCIRLWGIGVKILQRTQLHWGSDGEAG